MFTGIGLIAFCCIFGAGLVGFLLGRRLPESHRAEATQKIVQTMMNVVAILSALVLSLLIASTKTAFDTRNKEIEQFAASLTLLDRELMHYGAEAKDSRDRLRAFTARKIALTWPDRGLRPMMDDPQTVEILDDIEAQVRAATPVNEVQRAGQTSALQLIGELKRTSRLLAVQQNSFTPRPFLVVVIFWLSVLFLSYAVFAPFNVTVLGAMVICAVSVSIGMNLIFDMDQPFAGFIRVSPAPMQQALDQMAP
ncbi:MAG: DUF4239 domain-containing protein [Methylobacteriaceae bacterium]|nr:DUF4239 domain-containing protein [Methylobacteriaceae bacterium]